MARQTVFVDTSYIYAIINPNDQWHSRAVELEAKVASAKLSLITTQFILAEIADGLSAVRYRKSAAEIIHTLLEDPLANTCRLPTKASDSTKAGRTSACQSHK